MRSDSFEWVLSDNTRIEVVCLFQKIAIREQNILMNIALSLNFCVKY